MTDSTDITTDGGDGQSPKELREYADRVKAENAALRARVLDGDIKALGLDPSAGLGKAIAKHYDGEISAEAVAAYAKEEYGHVPEASEDTAVEEPISKEIETAQAKVEAVTAAGTSQEDLQPDDKVRAANDALAGKPDSISPDLARKAVDAKLTHFLENAPS